MSAIYDVIYEKLDRAEKENESQCLMLVGDYRWAYVMLGSDVNELFSDFLNGVPEYESMDVNKDADDSEQFEQFMHSIKHGRTFGDYQQFKTFADVLKDIRGIVESYDEARKAPSEIYDSQEFSDSCRVRINGARVCLMSELSDINDSFGELCEFLWELSVL